MISDTTNVTSFGELLKAFRHRRQLTQQLATSVGVHRHAIGRWERGDFLPESKGMVLELARVLRLDDRETRQFLESSLTGVSPRWFVPYPRNPFFTGREKLLELLHTRLRPDQPVALIQSHAVNGLGGIGKTQLAVEYAYQHALSYSAVFWIDTETAETIIASFLGIAELLHLSNGLEIGQERIVTMVHHWLSTHKDWLLIWDNVEELELLQRFLPQARQGSILITTRLQTLGTLALGVELPTMVSEEGVLFLLRRARILHVTPETENEWREQFAQRWPDELRAAERLVIKMGGLPLALDQAGAYIEETRCRLSDYLRYYEQQRRSMLSRRGPAGNPYPNSVVTTLQLSCDRVAERHPASLDLLRLWAFLSPESLPEEFLTTSAAHLGPVLGSIAANPYLLDHLFAALQSWSLLSRQPEKRAISIHRLVQAVVLDTFTTIEKEQWSRQALEALDAVFPDELSPMEEVGWRQAERLLPHVLMCLQRAETTTTPLNAASLAYKSAHYLYKRGQYAEAEPLFQQALQAREQTLGSDHPQVASALHKLACVLYELARDAEAESLFQRALHIYEHVLGPDHLQIASVLSDIAVLYWRQSNYEQAESWCQRALHIREQTLSPFHPEVASSLGRLALIYHGQNQYEQAEPLLQRALQAFEEILGPGHPNVALSLINLALNYNRRGKYEQAEPLYRRALHLCEQTYSPNHQNTAAALFGLADISQKQGKYEQAETLFQRVLSTQEQILSPDHPEIVDVLGELAALYWKQEKDMEAEQLYQRALSIQEQQSSQDHPGIAKILVNLGLLAEKRGDLEQAESLLKQASTILDENLGGAHLQSVEARSAYQRVCEQKRGMEATPGAQWREKNTSALADHRTTSHLNRSVVDPSLDLIDREDSPCNQGDTLRVHGPTLVAAFVGIVDHRAQRSRRHPLPAILALATIAMLTGARSLYAIALWGRSQPSEVIRVLGFRRAQTPARSSLHEMFHALDVAAFEEALSTWCRQMSDTTPGSGQREEAELRGLHGEEVPGVRVVAAYFPHPRLVVVQENEQ